METLTTNNKEGKILIISGYTPPATHGSGLMMFNLISRFPSHSFAVVTETIDKNPAIAEYVLPVPYYTYGNSLTSFDIVKDKKTFINELKKVVKKIPLIKTISGTVFLIYLVKKIVKTGLEAIEKESPSMLVGYSDVGPNLIATYILHKKTGIPFSLFFYDMYLGNKLPFSFTLAAYIFEPKLIRRAKHIFVMCDPLREHYKKKYSRNDITIIYNSLLPEQTLSQVLTETKLDTKTLNIAYIGNIYWAQEQALMNLVNAVKGITETPVTLTIYTYVSRELLTKLGIYESNSIVITHCLPEEVTHVLSMSDLAFVGLSFDTKYPLLINTSSPGRLCDFLRSKTPILIHAPKDSFIATYATQNDFAYVVSDNSVEALQKQILAIAYNKKDSKQKVTNANNTFAKNHDAILNAEIYYKTLLAN